LPKEKDFQNQIQARISGTDYEIIKEHCKQSKITVSAFIRSSIEKEVGTIKAKEEE